MTTWRKSSQGRVLNKLHEVRAYPRHFRPKMTQMAFRPSLRFLDGGDDSDSPGCVAKHLHVLQRNSAESVGLSRFISLRKMWTSLFQVWESRRILNVARTDGNDKSRFCQGILQPNLDDTYGIVCG